VIELAHLTASQKRAYVIADNRLALDAGWDEEMLALELADLSDAGYDLALTGFDGSELERLLTTALDGDTAEAGNDPDDAADDAADDVPEAPVVPVSRTGDVWAIGAHRLICGDATDGDVVATLMQGDLSHLCFTSPPYGNQRDYTSGGIADWDGLMRGVFGNVPMADDGQVLVNLGLIHRDNEVIPYWDGWLSWMRSQGWRRFAWYVWDQGPGMPGDWQGDWLPASSSSSTSTGRVASRTRSCPASTQARSRTCVQMAHPRPCEARTAKSAAGRTRASRRRTPASPTR